MHAALFARRGFEHFDPAELRQLAHASADDLELLRPQSGHTIVASGTTSAPERLSAALIAAAVSTAFLESPWTHRLCARTPMATPLTARTCPCITMSTACFAARSGSSITASGWLRPRNVPSAS